MDLLTVSDAITTIRAATAGSALHIGLYKNAEADANYSELLSLLKCKEDEIILDGPYKVYSEKQELITPGSYASGWINGKIWSYYKENPADLFDYFPYINGVILWPDFFNSLDEYIAAINSSKAGVNAVYDPETDRIIITALEIGESGNNIILSVSYDDDWPEEFGLKCSEGGFLSGGADEKVDIKECSNAIHVWIKHTDIPYKKPNDDTPYPERELELCIKMTVTPGLNDYPLTLDFTQRWSWDNYYEYSSTPVIHWGDGAIENISDINNISHTYAEPGEYEISMYDIQWCGWSANETPAQKAMPVTKIEFIKPQVISTPANCFRSLEILKKISGEIYISHSFRNTAGHNYMFIYDAELDDLSELIIEMGPGTDGNGIKTLNSIFWGCPKITFDVLDKLTIKNYNKNDITTAKYIFNAADMGSINNKLLGNNLVDGQYAYSHCASLTHLNGGLLDNLINGQHMFENTNIKTCDTTFGLPSLINGDCMFFGTELPFDVIKQIYDSLTPAPDDVDYGNGSNNEPENYAITFGYDINEKNIEERLKKLFNIDPNKWPDKLPFWILGQYDNSNDKKWYISFTNKNKIN